MIGQGMGMFGMAGMPQQQNMGGMFGAMPMQGMPQMPMPQMPTLSPGMFGAAMGRGGGVAIDKPTPQPFPNDHGPALDKGPRPRPENPIRIPNSPGAYFDAAIPAGLDYAQIANILDKQLNRAMQMRPRSTASPHFDVYDVTGFDKKGKGGDGGGDEIPKKFRDLPPGYYPIDMIRGMFPKRYGGM